MGAPTSLAGKAYTIVGVLPSTFRGVRARQTPALWVPFAHPPLTDAALTAYRDPSRRDHPYVQVIARLLPSTTAATAAGQVQSIANGLDSTVPLPSPGSLRPGAGKRRWTTAAITDDPVGRQLAEGRFAILLLPVLVLLIACTNLANLVLSRGAARRGEIAIRRALGASRWSLVREQLIEHGLVAIAGGMGGIAIARVAITYVTTLVQHTLGYAPQYQIDARVDLAALGATCAAAGVAVIVAGFAPAIQLTRGGAGRVFNADAASAASPRWRGRANLIALQVAASVALLLVAALSVRAILIMRSDARGRMDLTPVGAVDVALSLRTHDEADAQRLTIAIVNDARRAPGIQAAAVLSRLPGGNGETVQATTPGRPFSDESGVGSAALLAGTPDVFRALGVPILSGRAFDETDAAAAPLVAVVSQEEAHALFGETSAVGREVSTRHGAGPDDRDLRTMTVVGVVANAGLDRLDRPLHDIYIPFAQRPIADLAFPVPNVIVLARSASSDASRAVVALQAAVRRADPDLAVTFAGGAGTLVVTGEAVLPLIARITGVLALIALVLSMAGLYGVVSHVVAARTREMGIRIALGADRRRILRLVFADGTRPVVKGLAIGLVIAAIARMAMRPLFVEAIGLTDPLAILLAVMPLVVAAAIACYLPARRAAGVDPNVALRDL